VSTAWAQDPVEFDTRRVFACAEVQPPRQADTSRRVVVVVIPITATFHVKESTVPSLRYELRFPKAFTVLDYLPKTQTGTNIVGAQREQRQERSLSDLNVRFGGGGRVGFSLFGAGVNVSGGAERTKRDVNEVNTNIQLDRLPAQSQVIVAGTRDEGQTLYFDLKWFDQTTREGQADFAILAEVPKDWTGDLVGLSCVARRDMTVVSRLNKNLGLFLSGDGSARQRIEEQVLKAPVSAADDPEILTTSIGLKLKRIPAGTFLMGASPEDKEADADERPQHRVTISRPFYLGIHEVTQSEYKQIMGQNPSRFQDSDQQPVEQVSWFDAVAFCNKLSEREGRKPSYQIEGEKVTILSGNGFRLPTEAEWEYACRAGSETKYPFGDDSAELGKYAWFGEDFNTGKTHPVGQKQPNRWGLHDMLGNVWEWCQDGYDANSYKNAPPVDPPGPSGASHRVFRGGGWRGSPRGCRSADRVRSEPEDRSSCLGFRLAAVQD
jgi:formylglycine-generating enzyme required for sulfatase activity